MAGITKESIDLVLLQGDRRILQDFVQSIKPDDLENLSEILQQADARTVDALNWAAANVNNPLIMLATAESSAHKHQLSFEQTLSVLDALVRLEAGLSLDRRDAEDCATWLISGYQTKQGLNLMTELSTVFKNGVVTEGSVLQNSEKVDAALAEHFLDTLLRPLQWSQFLKVCDWLPKASMGRTLTTMLAHYKANDQFNEIRTIFAESYSSSRFGEVQLKAFNDTLGAEMVITLCQEQILKDANRQGLLFLRDHIGEETLFSGDFKDTVVRGLKESKPVIPSFMKVIAEYKMDLEEWPLTATLMIEHYTRLLGGRTDVIHAHIDQFAIKHDLQQNLVSKKIDALRSEFVSLDDWNHAEIKAKTHAEIFSMGVTQSKGHPMRQLRLKELLSSCKGADLVQMKGLLGGVNGEVVMAIHDVSGGFPNQKEVLAHYPQAKALFLEQDLGM